MLETAAQIIDALGGTKKVAAFLGVGPSAVSNYRKQGFPERAYYKLARLCDERGLNVSPALFGNPPPQTGIKSSALIDIFAKNGFEPINTTILQPIEPFLDRLGEGMRQRLYAFTDPSGREVCLRPDLTIPTALYYIENEIERNKNPSPKMRYCYQGTAFRYQPDGQGKPEEFTQAGFEIIGGADTDESRLGDEIEVMRLVVKTIRQAGIKNYEIRLNELDLFDRFITALAPAPRIQRRLKRSFKHQQNLQTTLETLSINTNDNQPNYLQGVGLQDANLQNADLVGTNFIGASIMGDRDMTEIQARIKQTQEAENALLEQAQIEAIKAYSSIECPIENMTNVFADLGLAVSKQFKADVKTLQARLMMIAKEADINPQAILFSSQYGRKLAYYTGLAFEIYATNQRTNTDKGTRRAIAGGGRYDDLIDSLQTDKMVQDIMSAPAIGAAIAVERLDAARPKAER